MKSPNAIFEECIDKWFKNITCPYFMSWTEPHGHGVAKTALKNINQKMILLTSKFTISASCDKIYYWGLAEEHQILIDDSF